MFVEALGAGAALYDNREKIAGAIAKILHLFREGFVKVTVFGAGGTGKSTLGRKLAGELSAGGAYHVSPLPEKLKLEQVPFGKITVFPGQPRRREAYFTELNERVVEKGRLLIHSVAYGYHALDTDSMVDHKSYKTGDDPTQFLAKHQRLCLDEELKVLEELVPLLIGAPRDSTIRLITLVSKQDLWWHQRQDVRAHYADPSGEYAKLLNKVATARGQHFEHTYLSASIEQLNLITNAGELLATTAAGYDDRIQSANMDAFVRHFYAVCGVSS